ncbi:MAG: hypothetical protein KGL39_51435 [Patescibacteria group bacterium]|nr:hypothetical protein [Patescibacteria group bacterium]
MPKRVDGDSVAYNWTPQTFDPIRDNVARPYNVLLPDGRKLRVYLYGFGWDINEVAPTRRQIATDWDIWCVCAWLIRHGAVPATEADYAT